MQKVITRILWGTWLGVVLGIIALFVQQVTYYRQKAAENEQYLNKIERSDAYSDYFFKRAAKVYVNGERSIASSWFYKGNYWITNKHVCDAFTELKAERPQIELWDGSRQMIVKYKVASSESHIDLCVFSTQSQMGGIEPAQLGNARTQNLYDSDVILLAAGFPEADRYELRAGVLVGEAEITISDTLETFMEQRVTIWVIPGMSGSAVYDAKTKKVIGVVAASGGGYGYIVPLSKIESFLNEAGPL